MPTDKRPARPDPPRPDPTPAAPFHVKLDPLRIDHYLHDVPDHQRQIAAIHALVLKMRTTTRRMRRAVAAASFVTLSPEGEPAMPLPANLDDAITELTATEADENTAAAALVAWVATVPAQIQAAVDAAVKLGATAAQLAQISQVGSNMSQAAAAMKAALVAPPATT